MPTGGGRTASNRSQAGMNFYTDDSPGLKITPVRLQTQHLCAVIRANGLVQIRGRLQRFHLDDICLPSQMFVIGMSVSFVLFVSLLHIIGKVSPGMTNSCASNACWAKPTDCFPVLSASCSRRSAACRQTPIQRNACLLPPAMGNDLPSHRSASIRTAGHAARTITRCTLLIYGRETLQTEIANLQTQ